MLTSAFFRIRAFLAPRFDGVAPVAHAPEVPVREIFRRFWPYARPYRKYLWLSLPFIVIAPAITTATIWLFKVLVDDVLVPRDFGPFLWLALAYLGLTLLGGAVGLVDSYLSAWVGQRFLLGMRTSVFSHMQSLSLDFFERRRLGDLVSRLTGDVAAIEGFMLSGVASALSHVLRIVFFAGAIFWLQWQLALISLVITPVFWLAARRVAAIVKNAAREKRRRSGSISAIAEESLSNIALVQAYNRQETETERLETESLGAFEAAMASTRIKALFRPLVNLVELVGVLLVIAVGTWQMSKGKLTLGEFLVFMTYLSRLYSPIRRLTRLTGAWYAASASAERIIEVLDERPSVTERVDPVRLDRPRGAVEFRQVSFRYPETAGEAVRGVSFTIAPGETLALVGPSGAGKSTLAKLLLRFYDPASGSIHLDGHDLRDLELRSLRDNIAVLLQDALVFDGTVRENIAYGRPSATEAEVVAAAKAADADEFVMRLPDGYDTQIGQKGRRLSGGQRQRVAIARAMIRDAPVLVLDEPTTGLDAESGERVLGPLRTLMDGRATIIISHNLMTVRAADMIVVLGEGAVVETGDHESLIAACGDYSRLYELHRGSEINGLPPNLAEVATS